MEDAGANITKAATENQGSQVRPGTETNNGNAGGGGIVKQDDNDSAKAGINLSAVTISTDSPGQPNDARIERIKALEIYKGYNHDMLDIEFGKFHSLQICIGQTSGMGYSYDVEESINLEPINQVKGISMLERKVSKQSWNSLPGATGGYTLQVS